MSFSVLYGSRKYNVNVKYFDEKTIKYNGKGWNGKNGNLGTTSE